MTLAGSSSAPYTIRILHLSDLHARGPRELEPWKRRRVLGDAWEENLQQLAQDGPIDLVCFTGDVADWGKAEEYESATEFFLAMLDRLSLPRERLFVVPGNHDIDRRVELTAWQNVRSALDKGLDEDALSQWMAGHIKAPFGLQERWRDRLLSRQAAYRRWIREQLGRPQLDPASSPHGMLGFRVTLNLPGTPFALHILGLDTSWLAGSDSDASRLRVTRNQLMQLATQRDGRPLDGLRVVMQHHPLSDLADGDLLIPNMRDHVDLLLRGHLHSSEAVTVLHPGQRLHQLAAGCLYDGGRADSFPNSCQVITLCLSENGRIQHAEVRFRSWSPHGGHWYDDDSRYKQSRGGRLKWLGTQETAAPIPADPNGSPFDPWTPVVPPKFVGRVGALERLRCALQEGRSVSVVGDWRIGKSSLLMTWEQLARQSGHEVIRVSGETSAGVSPAALVHAVTGIEAAPSADQAADVLERWASSRAAPPLLLLDESDGPISRFETRFFERVRGMLGKICIVLASRRLIDDIYEQTGRTSPFTNRLQLEYLGLLEPNEADQLIRRAPALRADTDRRLLLEWAGCHPFYLTLFARYLMMARAGGESDERALERFQNEASARLGELWRRALDDPERRALQEAAAGRPVHRRSLKARGLLTVAGPPFGRVLVEWLKEQP